MKSIAAVFQKLFNFVINNWVFILFVFTIIALILLSVMVISFIKERNRSDEILNAKALSEYELYNLSIFGDDKNTVDEVVKSDEVADSDVNWAAFD